MAVGLASPASANPDGTGLVISEAYGGGGNGGSTFTNDFIELYNPTDAAISVAGMSVQYRSSGGTAAATGVTELTGSVPAGGHYLVQEAAGSGGTDPLPTPDATGTISMSGSAFTVFLATGTTAINPGTGAVSGNDAIVDLVSANSNVFETAAGPGVSNTTSTSRTAPGADTDNNSADLTAGAPDPQNTAGADPDPDPEPTPDPVDVTIAEIQGTGATSPLAGQQVTTTGVVTAAYPTGGFQGFYLQTGGTGGAQDATPGASDGVFVYAPSLAAADYPGLGDSLQVTGAASERFDTTQVTAAAADITALDTALAPVTPLAAAYPTTEQGREAHESELLAPTDTFTVTNTFGTNQYGEIGLATGDEPLIQPTDVEDFQTGDVAAVQADNLARGVVLDDGASTNYLTTGKDTPLPWLTLDNPVRVGAEATLTAPVVLKYDFDVWRFQPQQQVTDDGADVATFEDTRTDAPEEVGGDVRLATFNVLNYFPTTGMEFAAGAGNTCTYFNDRAGNPITDNRCDPNGPRGAADEANLQRQQDKIVAAINALDAGIVSLEEIENSVKLGKDRDFAVSTLVKALNADAGEGTWDFAPSPAAADLPAPANEDVIRTAFIYKPAQVTPVGASEVLLDETNFDNAREPLAQAFKAVGADDADAFGVIVNHFKSKGSAPSSGDNADNGQGGFNADRIGQAQALSAFADTFAADRGIEALFLTGDFNSYTQEDPLQELYADGYTNLESDTAGETTYSFGGLSGSLDHVLANDAAQALITGVDIWNINSPESVAYEYSRFNYNVTDLYADGPFRASDHDPEVVGLDLADVVDPNAPVELNLLNINDFHGRIDANTTKFATTIEQLRAAAGEDDTLFLSAGDNIGASLFASSVQQDQPTIDVLNALGLSGSAVGNHEFDRGFTDLTDRVVPAAEWDYLGANVYEKGTQTPALPEYATYEVDGLTVGVIGAITQETPSLVSPDGIADLDFGDPVEAVNRVAAQLSDGDDSNGEADVLVAEYHEGASEGAPEGATLQDEIDEGGAFAEIATETSAQVDAIFTGHTHKQYAFDGPIPGESGTRPILQTGSYGDNIGQVVLTIDPQTGEVSSYTQRNVPRVAAEDLSFPRVAEVKQITDAALANAAEVGNRPVGQITADITTAYTGGVRDDRSAESTLGDLVADALRDGVSDFAEPDLGLTNPGGLRAELLFAGDTTSNPANTDGVVTFAEANAVLPFNNTVALVDLTGAQLKEVLEQQYQTNPDGSVPSRPYLALGLSDNVRVTSDRSAPAGSRITSVYIDDQPLDLEQTYSVSTLSFLAAGGDNFRAFTQGTSVDTGLLDAELFRNYLADSSPLSPDFARQQVFTAGLPAEGLTAGVESSFQLGVEAGAPSGPTARTLDLTSLGSPANTEVTATLVDGGTETELGAFPVTDGIAQISLTVPTGVSDGAHVDLVATPTGTTVTVPVKPGEVTEPPAKADSTTTLRLIPQKVDKLGRVVMVARVRADGEAANGFVKFQVKGKGTYTRKLKDGRAQLAFIRYAQPGRKFVKVTYNGNATTRGSADSATIRVRR